jgi:hypothetical protein
MIFVNFKPAVQVKFGWRTATREALFLLGYWSHRKIKEGKKKEKIKERKKLRIKERRN